MTSTCCIICTNPRAVKKSPKDDGSSSDQNNSRLELTKVWPVLLRHLSLSPTVYEEILKYYTKIEDIPFCFQHQKEVEEIFTLNTQLEEINSRIKKVTTNLSASIICTSSSSSSSGVNINQKNQKVGNDIKIRNLRTRCTASNDDKGASSTATLDTSKFNTIPEKQVQKKIRNLRGSIVRRFFPSVRLEECQDDPPKLLNNQTYLSKKGDEKTDPIIPDLKNADIIKNKQQNGGVVTCIQNEDIKSLNQDKNNEDIPSVSKKEDDDKEEEFENYGYDDDDDEDDPGFVLTNIKLNINQNAVKFSPKNKNEDNTKSKFISNENDDYQDDNKRLLNDGVPESFQKNRFTCDIDGCGKSFELKRCLIGHQLGGHKVKRLSKSTNENVNTKLNLNKQHENFQSSSSSAYDEKEVSNDSSSGDSTSNCTVTSTTSSVIVVNENYKNPKMKENKVHQGKSWLDINPQNNHREMIWQIDNRHGPRIPIFSPTKNIDLEKLEEYALLTDPSTSIPDSPGLNEELEEEERMDETDLEKEQQVSRKKRAGRKKKEEFVCEIENCGKILHSHLGLLMHKKLGHNIQPFACPAPECQKRFIKESLLELHVQKAHAELSKVPNFSLSTKSGTNMNFSSIFNFRKSDIKNRNTATTSSTQNNDQSTTTTTINSATSGMDGKQVWKCDDCPKEFQSFVGIYLHRKASHEDIDHNKFFSCPLCSQNFTLKVTLNHHLKTHDLVHLSKVFPCQLCSLSFTTSGSLSKHVARNHSVLGQIKGAGGRGRKQQGLVQINEHVPSKFGRGRKKKSNNNNNVRLPIFKCVEPNCGKVLASASSLSLHKRIHAGIRPFKCPVCMSTHVQINHLKCHMATHHPGIPMPKQKRFKFSNFQKAPSSTRTSGFVNNFSSPRPTNTTFVGGVNRKTSWNPSSSTTTKRLNSGPKPKILLPDSIPIDYPAKQRGRQTHNRLNVLWKCNFLDCNKEFSSYVAMFSHKRSHSKAVVECNERNKPMAFTQDHTINHHLKASSSSSSSRGMAAMLNSNIIRSAKFLDDEVIPLRVEMNDLDGSDFVLADEEEDIFEIEYDNGGDDDYSPSFF